jgi:cellulose synthase/poly-beta-1,6-N-acetylglucosamine synthase-like glycosyltransferase
MQYASYDIKFNSPGSVLPYMVTYLFKILVLYSVQSLLLKTDYPLQMFWVGFPHYFILRWTMGYLKSCPRVSKLRRRGRGRCLKATLQTQAPDKVPLVLMGDGQTCQERPDRDLGPQFVLANFSSLSNSIYFCLAFDIHPWGPFCKVKNNPP